MIEKIEGKNSIFGKINSFFNSPLSESSSIYKIGIGIIGLFFLLFFLALLVVAILIFSEYAGELFSEIGSLASTIFLGASALFLSTFQFIVDGIWISILMFIAIIVWIKFDRMDENIKSLKRRLGDYE